MTQPRIVPGEGPKNAKIVLIGEAPGSTENQQGRPFCGAAGILLDELLRNVGLTRQELYITNVVKEQPPKNDISSFINLGRKIPVISEEGRLYLELLDQELKECSANVLVPMGNVGLYALTRLKAIMKRRGSILTSLSGRKVIPTIHPAAALYDFLLRYPIIHDLRRIKDEAEFPEIHLPSRKMHLAPTFLEVRTYLARCKDSHTVAYDIEVMHNQVTCLAIAIASDECMCIPFVDSSGDYWTPDQEVDVWLGIASVLEDRAITKIGQNLVFDNTFLHNRYGIHVHNIDDTMIAHGILMPDFPKGLDFITSVYTIEPYYKDEGKKHIKIGGTYEDFWLYNAKDAAVCMTAMPPLLVDLERQGNLTTYRRQLSLVEPCSFLQEMGMRVDQEGMKKAAENATCRIAELEKLFHEQCGSPISITSPKQQMTYFYHTLGHTPYHNRATGNVTIDITALTRLQNKDVVIFKAEIFSYIDVVMIDARWFLFKIQHVWYDKRRKPGAVAQLTLRFSVYDNVLYRRQGRGECHPKQIGHSVYIKSWPFPVKVVVMGNCGYTGLSDKFRQGQTERYIHGNSKTVFSNDQIDIEFFCKFI